MSELPLPPSHSRTNETQEAQRFAAGQLSTWISVAVNAILTLGQIIIGLMANAQSLVADGMHSLSDMVSDFFVLYANRQAQEPADANHPYGHGRIETVSSFFLGVALLAVGLGFLWSGANRWQTLGQLPPIQPIAFWAALFTLAAKEGLFRYQLAVAERVRSPMLVANAWHQRADAASSLVVAVGIGGSLLGYTWGDLLASILVGVMIARMGWRFARDAMMELIDTGLGEAETRAIRKTLRETPGVVGLHELRTRRMAHNVLVDAHIQVGARISVSEGHHIAEVARCRVLSAHPEVLDVLVHIDPEEDRGAAVCDILPARQDILQGLAPAWAEGPAPTRVQLHYLDGGVVVEVCYAAADLPALGGLEALSARLEAEVASLPAIREWSVYIRSAP